MSNTLKVWESSFEPYLDPTQWPEYYGLDYVPNPDLLKTKKSRRKKAAPRTYGCIERDGEEMYGFGDFDEASVQVRCSKCHKTIHTTTTHKKRKKSRKLQTLNGSNSGSKNIKVHKL
jgi:hypothetical protein